MQLENIHEDYPYRVAVPHSNLYGMHLFSRLPLRDVMVEYLVESGVPSIQCYVDLPDGNTVSCYCVHPAPPSPTENASAKPRDKELLLIAERAKCASVPTIVTGDLNDVAWSPTTKTFRKRSGLKDPRIGRGFINTFHADFWFARWPLDHIFVSHHFALVSIKRLPRINSDHFPLFTEITLN